MTNLNTNHLKPLSNLTNEYMRTQLAEYDIEPEDYELLHEYAMFTIDSSISTKKLEKGHEIYLTYGGPTTYINTQTQTIHTSWWNEHKELPADPKLCETIEEILTEL